MIHRIAASITLIAVEAERQAMQEGGRRTKAPPVELSPTLLDALDAWIADQPDPKPSRPEVVRHALTDWLTGQGYLGHREDPEVLN